MIAAAKRKVTWVGSLKTNSDAIFRPHTISLQSIILRRLRRVLLPDDYFSAEILKCRYNKVDPFKTDIKQESTAQMKNNRIIQ